MHLPSQICLRQELSTQQGRDPVRLSSRGSSVQQDSRPDGPHPRIEGGVRFPRRVPGRLQLRHCWPSWSGLLPAAVPAPDARECLVPGNFQEKSRLRRSLPLRARPPDRVRLDLRRQRPSSLDTAQTRCCRLASIPKLMQTLELPTVVSALWYRLDSYGSSESTELGSPEAVLRDRRARHLLSAGSASARQDLFLSWTSLARGKEMTSLLLYRQKLDAGSTLHWRRYQEARRHA